jgi:AraC-like DNA-binding protein
MDKKIPTFDINRIAGKTDVEFDVFFVQDQINFKNSPLNLPYRSNYFGIGMCVNGEATLRANLETYFLEKNAVVTLSPHIIKEWVHRTADYETIAVFFTKDFFIQNHAEKNYLDSFSFFDANAKHVSKLNEKQAETIKILLLDIQNKLQSLHFYKNEIVKSQINILLFEILSVYEFQNIPSIHKQSRREQLTFEFKKLINLHFTKERSVTFYADLLFVTPKHLSEIIKSETGKTAKEWIDEIIILEAKVLLQDLSLSITNIADALSFADQSIFGKFFKNITGFSPLFYRQKW